jgi:hypothetical protein
MRRRACPEPACAEPAECAEGAASSRFVPAAVGQIALPLRADWNGTINEPPQVRKIHGGRESAHLCVYAKNLAGGNHQAVPRR